ncbi:MAG: hypothetical protein ACXW3Z_05115 [Limisphaerales bacterium]
MAMQIPFDLSDVRMIAINGNTIRFVLSNGHVEITVDSPNSGHRLATPSPTLTRTNAPHIMFDDGIYGI